MVLDAAGLVEAVLGVDAPPMVEQAARKRVITPKAARLESFFTVVSLRPPNDDAITVAVARPFGNG